ncbi:hypothetical protein LTR62_000502 [Meristemomyces frigidus]|uniref:Methyltransferase type 11 domain-containing protein n=1 Tax=Meristemomyces frigidus TaxID=1508187 RepID=A0AAN7T9D9_9PEZI|nr:hypothetical protein LTR62_000502 [Meristemomyces frigidus]
MLLTKFLELDQDVDADHDSMALRNHKSDNVSASPDSTPGIESHDVVDSKLGSQQKTPDERMALPDAVDSFDLMISEPESSSRDENVEIAANHSMAAAILNSNGIITEEDASADPMLAAALSSPLYQHANPLHAMFGGRKPGRPTMHRAPSILQKPHSIGNDWELYKRAGPPHPLSLDKLILEYHHHNCDSWQLAHDLGAGSGVYATHLAKHFYHIHISDPTSTGIASSRKTLSSWKAANPRIPGRFTFTQSKPEKASECVADYSVDLAVIMDGAHFTNAEETIRDVASSLVPKGTLAIVTHRPVSRVVGNQEVAAAVDRLFTAWGRRPWEVACGSDAKAQQQFSLGLDFIPLPPDLFVRDKTRRITINAHDAPREFFRVPGLDDGDDEHAQGTTGNSALNPDDMLNIACSRVDKKERRLAYGDEDEQARGWRFDVGWESFRTRIAMLDTPETVKKLEPYLTEIKDLVMRTSPNGVTVVIEWAVAVVLASKR